MYTENDFRLYHHGIAGQKWGKRNGPPYPLSSSISTGSKLKTEDSKHRSKRNTSDKKMSTAYKNFMDAYNNDPVKYKKYTDAYKKDIEKANKAKTDEEHDKLNDAADINNINRWKNSSVRADVRMEKYYADAKKYFHENKESLLSNAKNKDLFDLEFLEITQNDYDDMSESESRKKIIKDYEKYLDDPEEFTKRHYA